jgi:uncharacterized membrane protein (DUF485 family)
MENPGDPLFDQRQRRKNMLHEPATPSGKDPAASYKMRLGLWMFLFYSLFYAGFVAINLLSPLLMEKQVFLGLNFATVYGFALIIVALVEALIYDGMCRKQEKLLGKSDKKETHVSRKNKARKGKGK